VLIKILLRRWNLHDPKEGGVGSFVVSLMVLWYLTILNEGHWTLPDDHPQSPKTASRLRTPPVAVPTGSQPTEGVEFDEVNEHMTNAPGRLAPLLVGFLQYYGEQFPFKTTGVDLARGATFEKVPMSELHFVNPTLPGHNVAAAASSFGVSVRPRFAMAARALAGAVPKTRVTKGPGAASTPDAAAQGLFGDLALRRWTDESYRQFKQQRRQEAQRQLRRRAIVLGASQDNDGDDGDAADSDDGSGSDDVEECGVVGHQYDSTDRAGGSSGNDDEDGSDSDGATSDDFFANVIVRSPHMGPMDGAAKGGKGTAAGKKGAGHHRIRRQRARRKSAFPDY
jgi:hypothetical protein